MGGTPRRIVLVADDLGPRVARKIARWLRVSPGAYRRHFVAPELERHSA